MSQAGLDAFETLAEQTRLSEDQKRAARELVLLNPELLTGQYKDSASLSKEAERYSKDGNSLVAENRYASAVKLALYEGNPEAAKKLLQKCLIANTTNNSAYELAKKHFDSVSEFVLAFYRSKAGSVK
jgi:hypothetical protein